MVVSLLATKLYIPPVKPNLVNRQRLTERMLSIVARPGGITLISGPAGFGKTTLLSDFIQQYRQPVAWVSLDSADNDPSRFWTYFIKACQTVQVGVGDGALDLFRLPQPLPDEAVPTLLINDISSRGKDLVLVLDDYHVIQNQGIHSALAFLLSHLPDQLHLIFSTRVDPPWPLARLRSQGQLVEIRAADLRFTNDEAADFLNRTMGLTLSPREIASLEARTEGWIAGLQLAALSMRGRSDIDGFIKAFTGSHAFIADYLVEEVLQHQPQNVQAFLLRTSILERMNAGLCESVSGQKGGQAILTSLQRENLFILPLDAEGQWFRYHHLFADLLQARLKQSLPSEEILRLHVCAASWYDSAGMPEEAINHAYAAADTIFIERVVTKVGLQWILQGYVRTVEGWLQIFPSERIEASLRLNLLWAWLHLERGAVDHAIPYVDCLSKLFDSDKNAKDDPSLWGEWLAVQAKLFNSRGQPHESRELCRRALELLPTSDSYVRSMVTLELAIAYQQSLDYEHAAETFEKIAADALASGDEIVEILGLSGQARMMQQLGKLHRTFEIASKGIQRLVTTGKVTPFSATLFGEIGAVFFEWHEFDQANTYFQRSSDSSGRNGFSDPQIYQHVVLSRMHLMQGDREVAAAEMKIAAGLAQAIHPVMTQEGVICQQVRVELADHNLAAAQVLLEKEGFQFGDELIFPGMQTGSPITFPAGLLYNSALRLLLAGLKPMQMDANGKLEMATAVLKAALECQLVSIAIETLLLRSQMHTVLGNDDCSMADLIQALELAQPEGFITLFVEEGEPIQKALKALPRNGRVGAVQPDFIQKVLAAYPAQGVKSANGIPPEVNSSRGNASDDLQEKWVVPLTARELEVLRLIAAGDSNQAIAEKLFITVSAVKKHSGNIYAKLSVNSRTQAVLRARQLGLLIPDP